MTLSKELIQMMSKIKSEIEYSLYCEMCHSTIQRSTYRPITSNEKQRIRKNHIKEVHSAGLTSNSRL